MKSVDKYLVIISYSYYYYDDVAVSLLIITLHSAASHIKNQNDFFLSFRYFLYARAQTIIIKKTWQRKRR